MNLEQRAQVINQPVAVALMIITAFLISFGQLCWKLYYELGILILLAGFLFYITGSLLMLLAFRLGRLSFVHPLLSLTYIIALFAGYFILQEEIGLQRIAGVLFVLIGVIFICRGEG